ncbi:MAG: FAD-dependent oxidoreductase [Acidimicrobiia bacterium]
MSGEVEGGVGLSRRQFLGGAAAVAAGALSATSAIAGSAAAAPRRRKRPTVAVFGAGVAGLTAAHELVERGFDVTVYEAAGRAGLGGKARSIAVPDSATGKRRPLPGEHGFRFFPGFYQNVPDTMRRIPFGSNPNGVFDNLVEAQQANFARAGQRQDLVFAVSAPQGVAQSGPSLQATLENSTGLPPDEVAFFVGRLTIFLTSSDARRFGEWEHVGWRDFVGADRFSPEYSRSLAEAMTRNLVAAKANEASTRTIGNMCEAFLYTALRRAGTGGPDRLLNAPTNEALLEPWNKQLDRLGVRFRYRRALGRLDVRGGRVAGATANGPNGSEHIEADWFVCALPVERARVLWNTDVLAAAPELARMERLTTSWMNGIQFFLNRPLPIVAGHVSYIDSPWALTSISQGQFWTNHDLQRDYGDGRVADVLSVDISNWREPGIVFGKPAWNLQPPEIAREVLEQIKAHLNDTGQQLLTDDAVVTWFLDPAITYPAQTPQPDGRIAENREPLLINTIGSWDDRPEAATAIPNLFLAGDYVHTSTDLACMEAASESARRAVNALLAESDSTADDAEVFEMYRPPELEPAKVVDEQRYRLGLPHILDVP